jgi:hypothetical protein
MTEEKDKPEDKVDEGYTQRQWDRTVGIGKVPDEYANRIKSHEEKLRRYDRG